jgi:wyosine [tRNA(Phe)-imidazoG37] synthetase (radical SAM superfamily)
MPGAQELAAALEEALRRDPQVDAITLAGNGEPTLHPQLVEILDRVGQLRDRYAPAAKRVLLTNGIRLADPPLAEQVLARTEQIEIKLDAGTEQTFQQVARPTVPWSLARLTALLERLGSRVCVQCCLFGGPISNTSEADLLGMVEILKRARPRLTEIYSIDRAPAHSGLRAAPEACVQLAGMLREAGLEVFSYS